MYITPVISKMDSREGKIESRNKKGLTNNAKPLI